ncbi:amino acid permease [Caldanaerobacter sp.]|uniref:amino acid permease n=1 Tax=Caldanaerobacter sp. TaxID=2930036 RepID=UPI003C75A905
MENQKLTITELTLIGVGGILGAGFFLATGIAIRTAGPIVLFNYLISAFIMSQVFYVLSNMIISNPVEGTFRVYAEKALGDVGGFFSGWIYWTAGIFIMGSEVTASAIFTKYWFPNMPLWLFSLIYSILVITVNLMGTKNFGKIETWFSTIKITALFIIVIIGILLVTDMIPHKNYIGIGNLFQKGGLAPYGIKGFLASMLMSLIPFGGIEVIAMSSVKTKDPEKYTPIARKLIVLILISLYLSSIFLLLITVPWNTISLKESPFIKLLKLSGIPYIGSLMNFVILTAALTTMNGAMYGVTQVLYSLGQGRFAPTFLTTKNKKDVPVYALALSSTGLFIAVILSYLLPKDVYEYITSATGFVQFFNWIIILLTYINYKNPNLKKSSKDILLSWTAIFLIALTLSGTLLVPKQRVGFIGGFAILFIFSLIFYIAQRTKLFDRW